jgi:hypothetical protein
MKINKRVVYSFPSKSRIHPCFRRLGTFEILEARYAFSADSIDGRPYIDLGPSDNVALDQPRVVMQLIQSDEQIVGPDTFSTFLLDTGANTILTFESAVNDMNETPPPYRTEGQFEEIGVGGSSLYDISIAYEIDFAGDSGVRNSIPSGRIISDDTRDLSIFGPWGITGMPAMTERVTTLDFTPWTTVNGTDLFMKADFSESLPAYSGPRFSIPVDNRLSFSPEGSLVCDNSTPRICPQPPVWADLPFLTGQLKQDSLVATGDFLFDTGAQVSIMSTQMALSLGLDSNLDGVLDVKDANYARDETIGGIGGLVTVPVFLIDQLHLPTNQGVDLVWTDLQWLILDIIPGIDAILGFDNMTSGWIEAFAVDGQSGYIMQSQLDFRNWDATGKGNVYYDINPDIFSVVNPNGPGALVVESGGTTAVAEGGANDSYTISLSKKPTASVRVNLVPAFGDQVRAFSAVNPANAYVEFTPTNWDIPQTVVVSAVNDSVEEGFQRSFVKNISTSTDPQYENVGMPRVIVNVIDNDYPGVMILPSGGSTRVVEGGDGDTYQVVLTFPPTQPVTIELENSQKQVTAVASVGGASSLVFTTANWNVPQSVTVAAIDDTLNEGIHKTWITHRINSTDENYQQAFALQETVYITDNDSGDTVSPRIVDVIVGSSDWSPAFLDAVDGGGTGAGNKLGISLPGSSQLTNLSQNNLNKIYVKFNESVSSGFDAGKFALTGTNRSDYMPLTTLAYGVDGSNVVTISLNSPLGKEALVLSVLDTMIDNSGNRLDGEWVDGVSTISGNGIGRGRFNFRIDVLPGDVDDSGGVNSTDLLKTNSKNGAVVASRADSAFDINGNGGVNSTDLLMVNSLNGSVLPAAPIVPSTSPGTSKNNSYNGTNLMGLRVGSSSGRRLPEVLLERKQNQPLKTNLDPFQVGALSSGMAAFPVDSRPSVASAIFQLTMPTRLSDSLQEMRDEKRIIDESSGAFEINVLRTPVSPFIVRRLDRTIEVPPWNDKQAVNADVLRSVEDKQEFFADQLIPEIAKELDAAILVRSGRLL